MDLDLFVQHVPKDARLDRDLEDSEAESTRDLVFVFMEHFLNEAASEAVSMKGKVSTMLR